MKSWFSLTSSFDKLTIQKKKKVLHAWSLSQVDLGGDALSKSALAISKSNGSEK